MFQFSFFKKKEIPALATACVFTGHRHLEEDFSLKRLERAVEEAIKSGVTTFYNGMAVGFDIVAAETVLAFKKKYPNIKLIACIPCLNQDKYFSEREKQDYYAVLEKVDEQVLVSERYNRGCMLKRNRYMADRADMMIAYCNKESGGTAYTVNYFKEKRPDGKILFI